MSAQTEVNLLPVEFPDEPEEVTVIIDYPAGVIMDSCSDKTKRIRYQHLIAQTSRFQSTFALCFHKHYEHHHLLYLPHQ